VYFYDINYNAQIMSKRTILLVTILILGGTLLFGQTSRKGDLLIGISVGPNFSNLRGSLDRTEEFEQIFGQEGYDTGLFKDMRLGISTGIQLEYFLVDNLSLKSGVYYENKGMDLSSSRSEDGFLPYEPSLTYAGSITDKYKREVKNNYLSVPILLRKYFSSGKSFFVEGGCYFSQLINSQIDYTYSLYQIEYEGVSEKDHTNKLDYGFTLGTGYVKRLNDQFRFEVEMLFNYGLRKIDSKFENQVESLPPTTGRLAEVKDYYGLNSNAKNISFSINLGISYRIGK
jgi:hypothetical protein